MTNKKDNNRSIQSNILIDFNSTPKGSNKKKDKLQKVTKQDLEALAVGNNGKHEDSLKIIPLGGFDRIGASMMVMEYKDDIFIIDAGMLMPGGEIYGIDYIIPDITYLKDKLHKIKGIVITHGHLDHIGGLKHILPELGFPMVYGTPLSIGLIKKSLEGTPHIKDAKFQIVDPDVDIISLGCFQVEFYRVNHSIPESMGLAIHTPKGLIVHGGDYKIDFTPAIDQPSDLAKIARIGQEGVKLFFSDSTSCMKPGKSLSEQQIATEIENIIKGCQNRLIIATFSSLIGRIAQIIDFAIKYNKIVFVSGRSMINNIEIAKQLGYIKVPQGMVRKIGDDIDSLPDDRVVILTTGSQGEEFSALVRIAKGEHQQIKIREGDKIMVSAVAIPGNEVAVTSMINELIRKGADVITNKDLDIHVSGHGHEEDIKMMMALLDPEYLIPIHGELYMRNDHRKLAMNLGMEQDKILLVDNGQIIYVNDDNITSAKKKMHLDTVMIDGLGIGSMTGEYVMKARKIMAEDGMVTLIFKVDSNTKQLVGNIQIESRGFVYSGEVKKIHTQIVDFVKKRYYEIVNENPKSQVKEILKQIKEELNDFLTKSVGRVPMIVPMFVYINRDTVSGEMKDDMSEEDALVGMTIEEQGKNGN